MQEMIDMQMNENGKTRATYWKERCEHMFDIFNTFLSGRGKSLTVNVTLDYGAPLFGSPYVTEPRTYSRADVIEAVTAFHAHRLGKKNSSQHWGTDKGEQVMYTLGIKALVNACRETSIHQGREERIVVRAMKAAPRTDAELDYALDHQGNENVDIYTVEGLKGESFAKRKLAIKAACYKYEKKAWDAANALQKENPSGATEARKAVKASVKKYVRLNGNPIEGATTPQPVAEQSSVSASASTKTVAELRESAKQLGISGYSSMRKGDLEAAIKTAIANILG